MKYVISLLLTTTVYANPVRIFYEGGPQFAEKIREYLVQQYFIPQDLIGTMRVTECEGLIERGKLDLCLKTNGDLLLVSIDHDFVSESLIIFRTP